MPFITDEHYYDGGGYIADLGSTRSMSMTRLAELEKHTWLDTKTRVVFIESVLYNANTQLFSRVQTVFEIFSFGAVYKQMKVVSANLYRYVEAWDYIILAMQLLMSVVVCVRFIMVINNLLMLRCRYLLSMECLMRVSEVMLSIAAILFCAFNAVRTSQAAEAIRNNKGNLNCLKKIRN